MNSPCETCAFGNAGAAKEPYNALRSEICARGPLPFFCHHAKDGTEYDWNTDPLGPLRLAPSNRKMCAGWQARVRELNDHGFFGKYRLIRRVVAQRALGLIEIYLKKDNLHRKEKARVALHKCVKFLHKLDIGDEEIPL